MSSHPLPSWPVYSRDEIERVTQILGSGRVNYWTGVECREFEQEFAEYHGAKYAVALANGTLALELALRCLNVGAGDEVIVSPRSFFASASCVVQVGAKPVFADVDHDSQNITARTIAEKITTKTKAIVPVHLAGWPCDMPEIKELASSHGIHVVEDCAQAHGARIDGQPVGSFGDVAAFSFCQDKIMSTAGEGGMLITSSEELWRCAWAFKDHGKSWEKVYETEHPPGFRWLHESIGTNWRMTEIQGAIGRLQLKKLDDWVDVRNEHAAQFVQKLSGLDALRIPVPRDGVRHAYYKFYAFVIPDRLKPDWDRDRIIAGLSDLGCPGLSGSCPEIYRENAFSSADHERLPVARELGETSIMLPVHPTLREQDVEFMEECVLEVMAEASRVT